MRRLVVGLMIGGKATRFGGVAKGMLPAPDTGEPLAQRLARVCLEAMSDAHIVLVGAGVEYAPLGLPQLEDRPAGVGPLGGLAALLEQAQRIDAVALAIAADLPYVPTELVAKIFHHAPPMAAVAPRPSGVWQPLFARYSPVECLPVLHAAIASQRFAARAVLEGLGARAAELPLDHDEEALLDDWDTAEDVKRGRD